MRRLQLKRQLNRRSYEVAQPDETIRVMMSAVTRAKLGNDDRLAAIERLNAQARKLERLARGPAFDA